MSISELMWLILQKYILTNVMKRRAIKFCFVAAFCCCGLSMQAQTTPDGKKVKRVTFDREQVNIVYVDGKTDENVQTAVVANKHETAVKGLKNQRENATRKWYTLDGRKLQQKPAKSGLYIKNGRKVVINNK